MGLISTEVELLMNSSRIPYFEKLGYEIPKKKDNRGIYRVSKDTKINVKVSDLPSKTCVKILIKCDICGDYKEIRYRDYIEFCCDGFCCCSQSCKSKYKSYLKYGDNYIQNNFNNRKNIDGYCEFIKEVLNRDNYTCQRCQKTTNDLHVHHLDGFNWCIDKRIDCTNGITLCKACHNDFHILYGYGYNTKEQFDEWINSELNVLNYNKAESHTSEKIYCIEDGIIYNNVFEINKKYGIRKDKILEICNHKTNKIKSTKSNGEIVYYQQEHITAQGKHFLWYDEYLKMSEKEIIHILNNKGSRGKKKMPVICLTTNKVFNSITEAENYYKCSNIYSCCVGKYKHCGKLSDGTKLKWMYYDEYLEEYNASKIENNK